MILWKEIIGTSSVFIGIADEEVSAGAFLVEYVEERPWRPLQSPNNG